MPTAIDKTAFIREGLGRYAQARETVNTFQSYVFEAIISAFEAKADWKHFVPIRPNDGLELGKAPGVVYLHAYIAGHVRSRGITKAWLSLGLYWNPKFRPQAVVAATQCWVDGSNLSVPFNSPAPGGRVYLGPLYKRSERRLLLDAGADFDPEASLAELLDASDEALGPLQGGTGPGQVQTHPSV